VGKSGPVTTKMKVDFFLSYEVSQCSWWLFTGGWEVMCSAV